ncbi:MAG TPA: hypothetical protein VGG74_13815 [Kofleriaceae bacterium]|jgi:hypothetical protein
METLLRVTFEAAEFLRAHPPRLRDAHKQLVYELAGPQTAGTIEVTRWRVAEVSAALHATELIAAPGYYEYGDDAATWHVNFADPYLFYAYGSGLLAQDELQCAEHPALGSIREALGSRALTEEDGAPTPVLVASVERRCVLDTAPNAARPYGLYGNRFAAAPAEHIRAAVTPLRPPTRTNLVAIAAPTGSGRYTRPVLENIAVTAYTGFAAAVHESARLWPGAPVEVRTGFWGCGAFGGNRVVMSSLQIFAARLAGVARLRFYTADGAADLTAGASVLEEAIAEGGDVIENIDHRDLHWGTSNGT